MLLTLSSEQLSGYERNGCILKRKGCVLKSSNCLLVSTTERLEGGSPSPQPSESDSLKQEEAMEEVGEDSDATKTTPPDQQQQRPFNYDVVNVSQGFLLRTAYKKVVKTSQLDGFLERRVKQHLVEERQRQEQRRKQQQQPSGLTLKAEPASTAPTLTSTPALPPASTPSPAPQTPTLQIKTEAKPAVAESAVKVDPERTDGGAQASGVTGGEASHTGTENSSSSSQVENQTHSQGMEVKGALPLRTDPLAGAPRLQSPPQPADTPAAAAAAADCTSTKQLATRTPSPTGGTTEQQQQTPSLPAAAPSSTSQATPATSPKAPIDTSVLRQQPAPASESLETAEENGKGHKDEGAAENAQQAAQEDDSMETDAPVPSPVKVNGRDADMETEAASDSLAKDQPPSVLSNCVEGKVNSLCPPGDGKVPLKDSLKPLLNGDAVAVPDVEAERTPTPTPTQMHTLQISPPSVAGEDSEDMPPVKIPKLGNSLQDSAPTRVMSASDVSTTAGSTEHNSMDAERLRSEVVTPTTISPSPAPSAEDSSLSCDFAEGNGAGGSAETVVMTQLTTTTTTSTTVSTESRVLRLVTTAAPPGSEAATLSTPPPPSSSSSSTTTATQSSAVSTLTTTTTKTTVTQVSSSSSAHGQTDSLAVSQVDTASTTTTTSSSFTTSTTTLKGSSVSVTTSSRSSQEHSTRERVRLLKFTRTKKARSGTALPSYRKFVTKSCKKSIFVLPNDDLRKLARRGGIREVPIFSYNAKPALDIWPYPSPRPTFGITWRYVKPRLNPNVPLHCQDSANH